MQLSFAQLRRCRELIEIVESVGPTRREIAKLEGQLAAACAVPAGQEGQVAVGYLRDTIAHKELAAKQAELEALITRVEALAGDIAGGDPSAAQNTPRTGRERLRAPFYVSTAGRSGAIRVLAASVIGLGIAASFAAGTVVGNPAHGMPAEPLGMSVAAAAERPPRAEILREQIPDRLPAALPSEGNPVALEPEQPSALVTESVATDHPVASGITYLAGGPDAVEREVEFDVEQQDHERSSNIVAEAAPPTPTGTLFAGGLGAVNLRQAPSLRAPVVEVMAAGTRVGILEGRVRADGVGWQQVQSPSAEVGWVTVGTVRR